MEKNPPLAVFVVEVEDDLGTITLPPKALELLGARGGDTLSVSVRADGVVELELVKQKPRP